MECEFFFDYLTKVGNCWVMSNRIDPEARAMFAAMSSRFPSGGISQKYMEVLSSIIESSFTDHEKGFSRQKQFVLAEKLLTVYPVIDTVKKYIDKNVGQYGHSSIQDCLGSPTVFVEGVSPFTAYLSFDNPLVNGQEFSTRAVRFSDWPICVEASDVVEIHSLHKSWLKVFTNEVEWWKTFFSKGENRVAYGLKDKEPFRPALDRARWAIPSTISTGFCHTSGTRVMGRVIEQAQAFTGGSDVWDDIAEAYKVAVPALDGMWLKESVVGDDVEDRDPLPPIHLSLGECDKSVSSAWVDVFTLGSLSRAITCTKRKSGYLEPIWNNAVSVQVYIQCSFAVARDWHRHRPVSPWEIDMVVDDYGDWVIHEMYQPKTISNAELKKMVRQAKCEFDYHMSIDEPEKAVLCIPFGALVEMRANGGLRDVVYMLELRAYTQGANPEYKKQAELLLEKLKRALPKTVVDKVFYR